MIGFFFFSCNISFRHARLFSYQCVILHMICLYFSQQKTDDLIPGFQSMDISATKNMVYTQVGDNTKE